jgi:hypothetical protein
VAPLVHLPRSRQLTVRSSEEWRRRARGLGRDPLHLEPLAVHALRPECGRAIGVSKCCVVVPAGAHGARAARAAQLTSSHLPCASCRRGCHKEGAARPERATRAIMVRAASASAHPPCTVGGGLLFAHKFAGFPRTARTATHPPFPRRFPGRTSTEPLCTRVAADACECRLCPDLAATCVVALSQHGSWRARSCARVYDGTADEEDPHPSATMSAGEPSLPPPPSTTPPPETCACLLLLVHRALTLIFFVPAVGTILGLGGHASWWRSQPRRKKLDLPPRRLPRHAPQPLARASPCLGLSRSPLAHRQDQLANIANTERYFRRSVENATGPALFRTWRDYKAHMPRREAWGYGLLDLHACNYYVTEADKDSLVSDIFQFPSSGRPDIKYAVQGSNRGKSACVFQAVLHAESIRNVCIKYVHVAFHNNGGRTFKAKDCGLAVDHQGAVDRQGAARQGYALAVAILEAGLCPSAVEGPGRVFDLEDDPPSYEECLEKATKLLRDAAGTGAVLWHLDEWLRVFETILDGRGAAGVEHVRTGALGLLATAAAALGSCEDAAGTPRCTFVVTFIRPPDDTSIDRSIVGVPCVSERQYAAKKMPWLLDPRQCNLGGAEIDDAATRKLCNKALVSLRDYLTHNEHGGLTGLQTGSQVLLDFEERINEALETPGVLIPDGCAQFVPAGIAAAVAALADSCKELNEPTDLKYAAQMLLAVDVQQASTNREISKMLADTATEGLQSLPGGRFSYEHRTLLEGQPLVIAGDEQSRVVCDMCASSLKRAHAWTHPAKPLQPCARPTKRSVPSSDGPSPAGRSSHVRALASSYSEGRDLYANQFLNANEIMSGTPLERAYLWVLSCRSALTGRVFGEAFMCASRRRFPGRVQVAPPTQCGHRPPTSHCNRRCEEIRASRIFGGARVNEGYDLKHLRPGVMYYCLEDTAKQESHCVGSSFEVMQRNAGNWPSHPRADVFYLTGSGGNGPGGSTGLTLVDISGASGAAETKRNNLAGWIEAEEDAINERYRCEFKPFVVRGVVLAPFETRYKRKDNPTGGSVDVIFGAKAFALLGGLQQAVGLSED